MNECFIESVTIYTSGCWSSTPWPSTPSSHLNYCFQNMSFMHCTITSLLYSYIYLSYPVGTGGALPKGKATRVWSCLLIANCRSSEFIYASFSCYLTVLSHFSLYLSCIFLFSASSLYSCTLLSSKYLYIPESPVQNLIPPNPRSSEP